MWVNESSLKENRLILSSSICSQAMHGMLKMGFWSFSNTCNNMSKWTFCRVISASSMSLFLAKQLSVIFRALVFWRARSNSKGLRFTPWLYVIFSSAASVTNLFLLKFLRISRIVFGISRKGFRRGVVYARVLVILGSMEWLGTKIDRIVYCARLIWPTAFTITFNTFWLLVQPSSNTSN